MITWGFPREHLEADLAIAQQLSADCLEILPDWRRRPDPQSLRNRIADTPFRVHSVHGCWAGQTIEAARVDLGSGDSVVRRESFEDLARCLDWTAVVGGQYLIIHPGGLSDPASEIDRSEALAEGLHRLAEHARGLRLVVCVENMPPGVFPGSSMPSLAELVRGLARPEVFLALDTGHAHLNAGAAAETAAAAGLLATTHVHDNHGRSDAHLPPGEGTIDWPGWKTALDGAGYSGPIMLECIRHLREHPASINDSLRRLLGQLTGA